ncbi:hypothetical protein [Nocardioides allogilvus]|uniref:hypothetical protein n=1 Tax=Nocardioides allogilvus TaxID=2072017 RepID=UPI001300481C|nr:hypothetical protein [Nocardioides allogilvus]
MAFMLMLLGHPSPGWANHGGAHSDVTVDPNQNVLTATAEQSSNPITEQDTSENVGQEVSTGPQPVVIYKPVCLRGDPTHDGSAFGCPSGEQLGCGEGGSVFTVYVTMPGRPTESSTECIEPGDPVDPGAQTPTVDIPGEALSAFKRVELPASTIEIQPPGGETLVNFKTILSTQAERHQIPVTLEKVKINLVLEVWPSHFVWHHGDGTEQESAVAGVKWTEGADVDSAGFITHVYTTTLDAAQVSVDTTWSAQFKVVGDKDWRPVDGTVTKVGAPATLGVLEAKPQLVTSPN